MSTPIKNTYGFGWRHIITVLSFWGFFCMYTMRVNLSMALVAMVNHTHVDHGQIVQNQCHQSTNNYTETKVDGKFEWDEELQGVILSAFYYGYITTQIPAGLYAIRHGGKWLFGFALLGTSILTLLMPLAAETSAYWLVAARVLEGVVEGVTWPAMHTMFSRWAPPMERSVLPAFAYSGCFVGTVVTFLTSGYLSTSGFLGGWPLIFYYSGTIGCIWFIFWAICVSDCPENHKFISVEEKDFILESLSVEGKRVYPSFCDMPWRKMMMSLPLLVIFFSHFAYNWGFYTLLTQLPAYFKNILGFDIEKNGLISALPYVCIWIIQIVTGLLADCLRTKFRMATVYVRKLFDCAGHLIPGLCLVLLSKSVGCDSTLAVSLLTIAVASTGFTGVGVMVNHLDIAPKYSGLLFGMSNTIATVPGIAGPYIVGVITKGNQTPEAWGTCFLIAAGINFASVGLYGLFAAGEVQDWARDPHPQDTLLQQYKQDVVTTSLLDVAVLE